MNECEKYGALISAYVDSELSNEESGQIERHCAVCQDCHREAEMLRDLKASLKENMVQVTAPVALAEKISRINTNLTSGKRRVLLPRWAVASAAVLLVIVGVVFFLHTKEQSHFFVLHSGVEIQNHIDNCSNCKNGSTKTIKTHMSVSIIDRDQFQKHLDGCRGCHENIGIMVKNCMASMPHGGCMIHA